MSVDFSNLFRNVCNSSKKNNGDSRFSLHLLSTSPASVASTGVSIQTIINGLTKGMEVSEVESTIDNQPSTPSPESTVARTGNCDGGGSSVSTTSSSSSSPLPAHQSPAGIDEVFSSSETVDGANRSLGSVSLLTTSPRVTNVCDDVKLGSTKTITAPISLEITDQSAAKPFRHHPSLDFRHDGQVGQPSSASFLSSSASSSSSPVGIDPIDGRSATREIKAPTNSVANGIFDESSKWNLPSEGQRPPCLNTANQPDSDTVPEDENGNAEKLRIGVGRYWRQFKNYETFDGNAMEPRRAADDIHSLMPSSTKTSTSSTVSASELPSSEVVRDTINNTFSAQRFKSNHDGKNGEDEEREENGELDRDEGEKKNDDKTVKSLASFPTHYTGKESDSSNRSFNEDEEEETDRPAYEEKDNINDGNGIADLRGGGRRMSHSEDESSCRKMARLNETGSKDPPPLPWNLKYGSPLDGVDAFLAASGRSIDATPCTSDDDEMEDDDFDRRYKVSLKQHDDYLDMGRGVAGTYGMGVGPHSAGSGRRKQKNPVRFDVRFEGETSSPAFDRNDHEFDRETASGGSREDRRNESVAGDSPLSALLNANAAPSSRCETPASDSFLPYSSLPQSASVSMTAGLPPHASAPSSPFGFNVDDSRSNSSVPLIAHNNGDAHHRGYHRSHRKAPDGSGLFRRLSRSPSPEAPLDLTVHKRSSSASSPPAPSASSFSRRPLSSSSSSPAKNEIVSPREIPPRPLLNPTLSPFCFPPVLLPLPSSAAPSGESASLPATPSLHQASSDEQIARQMFQEKLRQDLLHAKLRTVAHQRNEAGTAPHLPFLQNPHPLSLMALPPPPPPPAIGASSLPTQVEPLQSFSAPSPDEFFLEGFNDFDAPGEHFKCPYCEIVFTYKTSLYRHIKSFHQIGEVYACDKCGYVSPRKDKFKSHLVVHEREGRVQKHSNNVRHRIKADPLEESYNCLCGYRTWVKSAYDKHVQQHQMGESMGEVPLSCKICGENFKGESELENHMRTHKENSHYLCDICGFASVQMKKVIEHRRTHTGEKPFECKVCSYRCARRDNLMLHYRKRHKTEAVLPRIRQRVRHKTSEASISSSASASTSSVPAITYPMPQQQHQPSPGSHSGATSSSKPTSLQSLLLNPGQPSPIKVSSSSVADRVFRPPALLKQTSTPPILPLFNPPPFPPPPPPHVQRLLNAGAELSLSSALTQDLVLPAPFAFPPSFNNPTGLPPPQPPRDERDLASGEKESDRILPGDREVNKDASISGASSPKSLDKPTASCASNAPAEVGINPWPAMPSIDMNLLNVIQRFSHDEKRLKAIMEAHFNHSQRQLALNVLNEAAVNRNLGEASVRSSSSSSLGPVPLERIAHSTGFPTHSSLPTFPLLPPPPPHQYSSGVSSESAGHPTDRSNPSGESQDPGEAVRKLLLTSHLPQSKASPGTIYSSASSPVSSRATAPFFSAQGLATVSHYSAQTISSSNDQKAILSSTASSLSLGDGDRRASTPSPNQLSIVEPPPHATSHLFGGASSASVERMPPFYNHNNKLARQLLSNPASTSVFSFSAPAVSLADDGGDAKANDMEK